MDPPDTHTPQVVADASVVEDNHHHGDVGDDDVDLLPSSILPRRPPMSPRMSVSRERKDLLVCVRLYTISTYRYLPRVLGHLPPL